MGKPMNNFWLKLFYILNTPNSSLNNPICLVVEFVPTLLRLCACTNSYNFYSILQVHLIFLNQNGID